MEKKLGDAELKVMQVLWRTGGCPARQVAEEMTAAWGWNANTTYTLLRRCVQKGAVRRTEPGFFCTPCVAREEVQRSAAGALLEKLFEGSAEKLFAALLGSKRLSKDELARLEAMVAAAQEEEQP